IPPCSRAAPPAPHAGSHRSRAPRRRSAAGRRDARRHRPARCGPSASGRCEARRDPRAARPRDDGAHRPAARRWWPSLQSNDSRAPGRCGQNRETPGCTAGIPSSGAPMPQIDTARLLIACDDQPGIVAAVAGVLASHGANIISLDQHSTDEVGGRFFQRTVIHLEGLSAKRPALEASLAEVAERFAMEWSLHDTSTRKRVAIFVSKYDHCLMELLWRTQRGELDIDVTMVISNHPDLAASVRSFGVPFVHVPRGEGPDAKAEMEARQLELLQGNVDLVVLARYMQILSDDFIDRVGAPVIN